ncbi:MAG: ABC transporter substrate-binding protein [Acidimicrobiales bacterium]
MRTTVRVGWRRFSTALMVGVLVASGCSIGDEEDVTASTTARMVTIPTTVYVPPTDDDDRVETIEDLEGQWAAQRAAVVADLGLSQYGIDDDNRLNGPGELTVDLDACPSAWSETAGLETGTIRVGLTTAQTGDHGDFGELAVGMQAYFDYVNENGGVDGRSIELVVRDDGYDPAATETVVGTMLSEDDVFYITTVGSPGSLAVYGELNEQCIPQPFVVSAHPAWADPTDHPWTSGFQLSYSTEAVLWGQWIRKNLADRIPVKVGALVTDNDFGRIYADTFSGWAEVNSGVVSEVVAVTHDPAATTVESEMAELAAADPDVFVSMTAGEPCVSAIQEAQRTGLTVSALALFTPSVCRQPATYMTPAGDAAQGFLVVGAGVKSTLDPQYADETFIAFTNERLTEVGLDPAASLVGIGFAQYGWAHVELLRVAAALPGGLTRTNVLLAMRSLDLHHPMLLDGVNFATRGVADPFVIEGAEVSSFDVAIGSWLTTGPALDIDGFSPPCRWSQGVCQR